VLLLSHQSLVPLAYNREALEALVFPKRADELCEDHCDLVQHIGDRLIMTTSSGLRKFVRRFKSGSRVYLCRTIPVDLDGEAGSGGCRTTLLLLERDASPSRLLERKAAEDYGLTRRERQIVELVIDGMTTKEMAATLNLSPNTVKSFLRLIMTKMRVTTRSGIVGKVLRQRVA
jgi:DNA-binding CsgD family transcriptional regulator